MYLTTSQIKLVHKIFGCTRVVYNYYLGKKYIQIDSYYPSSQICSKCGYKNEEVKKLSVRSWICPECGSYHDRDYNASYNILFEGLKKYIQQYI